MTEAIRLEDQVEFAENPEPRCPCVLLLDTSGSMKEEDPFLPGQNRDRTTTGSTPRKRSARRARPAASRDTSTAAFDTAR